MPISSQNSFTPGRFSNYVVGGNVCNAFAVGDLGSTDDFFLIGAEPQEGSNYPLLTGNVLDSQGKVLCRLVKNALAANPGGCSKVFSDRIGFEIHDRTGRVILKVATTFERPSQTTGECFVTTVSASFHDRNGALVFASESSGAGKIEASVKCAFGFSGNLGHVQNMDAADVDLARVLVGTRGTIHQVLRGPLANTTLALDGMALLDAQVSKCVVNVASGDFLVDNKSRFVECQFNFVGAAANVNALTLALAGQRTQR